MRRKERCRRCASELYCTAASKDQRGLRREEPSSRRSDTLRVMGVPQNIAMPGFTAPKIAWVRKHEPQIFDKIAKVLLPKAYVRLLLTGEHVEDMSDAAGTLWLDVAKRDQPEHWRVTCPIHGPNHPIRWRSDP